MERVGWSSLHFLQGIFVADYTRYQQKIIKNYYDQRENISMQRAQEILTELYLTEGKKRQKHWESLFDHLRKLGVKDDTIQHLKDQDDPQLVAGLLERLMKEGK